MRFIANEGKSVGIEAGGDLYLRHAVQTEFVTAKDNYIDIIEKYVKEIYREGDFISISEKIISICQHRFIRKEDMKISRSARILSGFACRENRGGYGVGSPFKMQYAINKLGLPRVFLASIAGALGKLFGIKGLFYRVAGREVSGLDGFYDGAWEAYGEIGIEIPADSNATCNEIKEKLGISCMIVDSNDFGQEILGKSDDIKLEDSVLKQIIRDNPAGQGQQRTPIILIRKVNLNARSGI